MLFFKVKKSLALAFVTVLPVTAFAVSETRKITIPTQQVALPSIETAPVSAYEHPTATHIPVENISAISEIMDSELEGVTEELDSEFLTATEQ